MAEFEAEISRLRVSLEEARFNAQGTVRAGSRGCRGCTAAQLQGQHGCWGTTAAVAGAAQLRLQKQPAAWADKLRLQGEAHGLPRSPRIASQPCTPLPPESYLGLQG